MAEVALITGMSGAGRSAAANVLEDLGWYVVDNLPTSLVDTIVEVTDGFTESNVPFTEVTLNVGQTLRGGDQRNFRFAMHFPEVGRHQSPAFFARRADSGPCGWSAWG